MSFFQRIVSQKENKPMIFEAALVKVLLASLMMITGPLMLWDTILTRE